MAKKNFAAEAERDASFTSRAFETSVVDRRIEGTTRLGGAVTVSLTRIERDPNQVRQEMDLGSDEMKELAESISAHGILQPLTVFYDRPAEVYRIISGERRYHAAKLAGLESVPCLVRDRPPTGAEITQLQLIENLHRKGMSPLDEAAAYRALNESHNLKLDEIAKQVGKSKAHVSKALRLSNLPDDIKSAVSTSKQGENALSFEHLYEVAKKTSPDEQRALFEKIRTGGLNVRELRKEVEGEKKPAGGRPRYISHKYSDPEGEFWLVVHFKKTKASPADVELALKKALADAQRAQQRARAANG
ncbi:MAG: ParB/RepB/Spo0J family partition protein [Deltaproteobacteria bacterium]|nr:ParB/RepB/Spo0J family partition protein [Deltaproteobacteria bacterium]